MSTCPICGEPIPVNRRVILTRANLLAVIDGKVVKLTRQEFDLFEILWHKSPQGATYDYIRANLWPPPLDEPLTSKKVIEVTLHNIRRKLVSTAAYVETTWGVSLSLKLEAKESSPCTK